MLSRLQGAYELEPERRVSHYCQGEFYFIPPAITTDSSLALLDLADGSERAIEIGAAG